MKSKLFVNADMKCHTFENIMFAVLSIEPRIAVVGECSRKQIEKNCEHRSNTVDRFMGSSWEVYDTTIVLLTDATSKTQKVRKGEAGGVCGSGK